MATDLTRIGEKARRDPQLGFTSRYHHITDVDNLRDCYVTLAATKATGVEGVTKAEYGQHLEATLQDLSARLTRMAYRPGPKQRRDLPKAGSAKGRPLGMSNLEDKMVEQAVKRTLEPIYEAVFEDSSYGYRPGRSQQHGVHALGKTIQQKRINQIVEADITRFFETVNWEWLIKCLRHRIGDERVIRLILRMLNSGIREEGRGQATEAGTPQGSILSPLLSNITLHDVLDLWFSRQVRRHCRGDAYDFRVADDCLACFQDQDDAQRFRQRLKDRLEEFGLELAEEKTHCIEVGRYAREHAYTRGEKPAECTFLGLMHYCGKTRQGYVKVKRRTSRKKLGQSVRTFTEWIRKARGLLRKGELLRQARTRVVGHLNYYAITDNAERCSYYVYRTKRILFTWLNRKSQRKAYTWEAFAQALAWVGWPTSRIRTDLNPCRRAEAC